MEVGHLYTNYIVRVKSISYSIVIYDVLDKNGDVCYTNCKMDRWKFEERLYPVLRISDNEEAHPK